MRSLLFVPADSPRKFAKALDSAADTIILDLEDSVALAEKERARQTLTDTLRNCPAHQKRLIVRINAFDTGLALADLAAVVPLSPDAIMLPKARGAQDIEVLGHYLSALEVAAGLPEGRIGILPIATETGEAVLGLGSYQPHPRLIGLMWGAEDLIASLGATANRTEAGYTPPFHLARSLTLMAAAKAGVPAIDTPCPVIGDLSVLEREAAQARRDGFGAKCVIHPSHIEVVNRAFTPTEAEINWARQIVAAFEEAPQMGVVQIAGKMVDKPHERAARHLLAGLSRE